MVFKAKHVQNGGHITIAVFSAISANHTFAGLGVLTMDERDFESFKRSVRNGDGPDGWLFEERRVEEPIRG